MAIVAGDHLLFPRFITLLAYKGLIFRIQIGLQLLDVQGVKRYQTPKRDFSSSSGKGSIVAFSSWSDRSLMVDKVCELPRSIRRQVYVELGLFSYNDNQGRTDFNYSCRFMISPWCWYSECCTPSHFRLPNSLVLQYPSCLLSRQDVRILMSLELDHDLAHVLSRI